MKMLELSDAVSMFENKMQTATEEIKRVGKINSAGIKFENLDLLGEKVLVTCDIDGLKTHILMTAEKRLPFGDTRKTIKENGLEFLFQNTDSLKQGEWKYSFDLSDDDNSTKYLIKNEFFASYSETPLRDSLQDYNLQAKLVLYFANQGKTKNVDGIAVLEIGNELSRNSGLVHYYNFRVILESDVKYL